MEILIQYPYREECKSVETDEQAALDNGAKRQAEQVRHRRPAARRAAKFLLPPTHPTEGYTMICNTTGPKIKSNSYGDRQYGETDKVKLESVRFSLGRGLFPSRNTSDHAHYQILGIQLCSPKIIRGQQFNTMPRRNRKTPD